jgi:ubiquinone/menaquinone biosynthesis C-methylase UbiE
MYVLHAANRTALGEHSRLFQQHMEPLLQALEAAHDAGKVPMDLPEMPQYLQVCRWPFRKLEYSFALEALLGHLRPGERYLDAGSGVTPLAQALARSGVDAHACDGNERLIAALQQFAPERIYGVSVTYTAQDLTRLTYPDESFDAISCISVLEHIPAPLDQQALNELLRVLKPGGLLVVTVDYTPPDAATQSQGVSYFAQRVADLVRQGNFREIKRGVERKLHAQQAVRHGEAQHARSANQCFTINHLEQDLFSALREFEVQPLSPYVNNLCVFTSRQVREFWDLEDGLFQNQGRRLVLPAAGVFRKPISVL